MHQTYANLSLRPLEEIQSYLKAMAYGTRLLLILVAHLRYNFFKVIS